jgi:hypothetical protein
MADDIHVCRRTSAADAAEARLDGLVRRLRSTPAKENRHVR